MCDRQQKASLPLLPEGRGRREGQQVNVDKEI